MHALDVGEEVRVLDGVPRQAAAASCELKVEDGCHKPGAVEAIFVDAVLNCGAGR